MNRQRAIVSATILLVVSFVCYWVWSGWGLITVETNDMKDKSLAAVMRSIEKQAGIVMRSNMDPAKPVTMHVHKVSLHEALETLGSVTDSRCRLRYYFAADKGTLSAAIDSIGSGTRPEGWKSFDVPMYGRPGGDDLEPLADPRLDTWNVTEPADKTLQGFMQAAAVGVSASFTCPEGFNPAVSKSPSSGAIRKAAPQLAKIAGAKVQEVFLLMGRPAGVAEGDRNRDDDDSPFGGGSGRGRSGFSGRGGGPPNFDLARQRLLAEIAKLPAADQARAKAEFDEREKFFKELRELPDDQRRAKMEEYAKDPANQDKMADRQQKGNERKTPDQRLQKYQSYVARKQAVMNSRGQ